MRKIVFFVLLTLAAFATIEAAQNYVENAKSFVLALSNGNFERAEEMFTPRVAQALPVSKLGALWNGLEERYGIFQTFSIVTAAPSGTYEVVVVKMEFKKGTLNFKMIFDLNMKMAGFWIKQAQGYHLPPYAALSKFSVKRLEIGTKWKLPAKLTTPIGKGPFPAVVLIGGSGPTDMNESVGVQRPFEDIAYGLSSQGIVVLRYDKRPHVYAKQMLMLHQINVQDVYLQDASYAIAYLKKLSFVKKVFVLGNSLGAYLVPAIAQENPSVAGLIMLSSPARPFANVLVDQIEYLLKLDENNQNLKKILREAKLLEVHEVPSSQMVLGAPASYYYELEKYAPITILKKISKPTLICRGGKDYQVPQKDFDMFEKAFSSNKLFTFKVYHNLSHIFTKVNGTPSPANYEIPENVSKEVIVDLAKWIKSF